MSIQMSQNFISQFIAISSVFTALNTNCKTALLGESTEIVMSSISTNMLTLRISGCLLPDATFLTIFYYYQGPELMNEKAAAFENYTKCFFIWNILLGPRAIPSRGETNFSNQNFLEGV